MTAAVSGANRGLGLAACRELARRGYRVLLTGVQPQPRFLLERARVDRRPNVRLCASVGDALCAARESLAPGALPRGGDADAHADPSAAPLRGR